MRLFRVPNLMENSSGLCRWQSQCNLYIYDPVKYEQIDEGLEVSLEGTEEVYMVGSCGDNIKVSHKLELTAHETLENLQEKCIDGGHKERVPEGIIHYTLYICSDGEYNFYYEWIPKDPDMYRKIWNIMKGYQIALI